MTREEFMKVIKQARAEVAAANEVRKEQKTTAERPSKLTLHVEDYSEKSIIVYGDTKWVADELKSLTNEKGRSIGRFNSRLTVKGKQVSGWVFSKNYERAVRMVVEALRDNVK